MFQEGMKIKKRKKEVPRMTKTVWKDTVTGKIYRVDTVEEAASQIATGMSFEAMSALIDEKCSKTAIIKFLINRENIYDIVRFLLIERFEQTEINISKKWIEDDIGTEFYSYEELFDYINKNYDADEEIAEYLDDHYEPSDIVKAIERDEYQELLAQAKSKVIQNIIDCCFTVTETEI